MKGGLALSIASRRTGFLPYSQTPGKAILEPLQIAVNQRPAEAKITFETSETTFEVISLRSYVSILLCGTIMMVCTEKSEQVGVFAGVNKVQHESVVVLQPYQ